MKTKHIVKELKRIANCIESERYIHEELTSLIRKLECGFSNEDIGGWFTYVNGAGKECVGKLKSFDNDAKRAFIVYSCNEEWDNDRWKEYTACATRYENIKELQKIINTIYE